MEFADGLSLRELPLDQLKLDKFSKSLQVGPATTSKQDKPATSHTSKLSQMTHSDKNNTHKANIMVWAEGWPRGD